MADLSKLFSMRTPGRVRPLCALFLAILAACMAVQAWSLVPTEAAPRADSGLRGSTAYGVSAAQQAVSSTVSAAATLTLSPSSGAPGTLVLAQATGFTGNETVDVFYDNTPLTTTTAANGAVSFQFVIPTASTVGANTVSLLGYSSNYSTNATFTVTSSSASGLMLSPSLGPTGSTVTASGYIASAQYFKSFAYAPILISIAGTQVASTTTDASGHYSVTFTVPTGLTGAQTVTAYGSTSGFTASATFTVGTTQLSLSSSSGVPGTVVTASGSGFLAGETVNLNWSNGASAPTVTADNSGGFSESITVPTGVSTSQATLTASGASSLRTATASLTVISAKLSASVVLPAGDKIALSGTGFAPGEAITLTNTAGGTFSATADAQGNLSLTVGIPATFAGGVITFTAQGATSQADVTATVTVSMAEASPSTTAAATATAATTPGASPSPTASATPSTTVVPSGSTGSATWYFAAGRTDGSYGEQIDILNPSSGQIQGTITAYFGAGKSASQTFTLGALRRGTYDVGAIAGHQSSVAVVVAASEPIAAAATGLNGTVDRTALNGVAGGSTKWYFAEGYTGLTFKETLSLFNPGATAAGVQLLWPVQGSKAVRLQVTVPAHSVLSVPVNQYVKSASHATIVTSNQKVIAARTLIFGAAGQSATVTHGATSAGTTLYFAEGSTANGFQEFVSLLNPQSASTAHVTVTFYGGAGTILGSRTVTIAPLGRASIAVNSLTHASSVAATVRSDVPVLAERSMYMGSPNSDSGAGTDVFAAAQAATGWAFAAGDTGSGQKEFITLLNPGSTATTVVATWYESSGQLVQQSFSLNGHARLTVDVVLSALTLPAGVHGLVVQSTDGAQFVAEEALYSGTLQQGAALVGEPVS